YGLTFVHYPALKETMNDIDWRVHDKNNRISILTELNELDNWIKVYCNSFNLENKSGIVFDILKKNFKKFIFVLYSDNYDGENKRKMPAGCCLLYPYKNAVGLYCLGTVKEFRNKNIASRIIQYSILQSLKNDYQWFILQTLKSDNLLPFYERHGFCKIYSNKIFGLSSG
ncbi:MAG: GNAT family N-acetyltransferase, partial [Thermoproteota archaeon]|nr:GNAT family N-acetyltransferase [Thermoproteota archaeon]